MPCARGPIAGMLMQFSATDPHPYTNRQPCIGFEYHRRRLPEIAPKGLSREQLHWRQPCDITLQRIISFPQRIISFPQFGYTLTLICRGYHYLPQSIVASEQYLLMFQWQRFQMKVRTINRSDVDFTRDRVTDLHKVHKNLDPALHPFEKAVEYTRSLNAVKLDR